MQINIDKDNILSILETIVDQVKNVFDNQFPGLNKSHKNYLFIGLIIIGFFLVSKIVGFVFKFAIIFIVGALVGFYVMKRMNKE